MESGRTKESGGKRNIGHNRKSRMMDSDTPKSIPFCQLWNHCSGVLTICRIGIKVTASAPWPGWSWLGNFPRLPGKPGESGRRRPPDSNSAAVQDTAKTQPRHSQDMPRHAKTHDGKHSWRPIFCGRSLCKPVPLQLPACFLIAGHQPRKGQEPSQSSIW